MAPYPVLIVAVKHVFQLQHDPPLSQGQAGSLCTTPSGALLEPTEWQGHT